MSALLLASLAFAQDPFGESLVDEVVPVNPETIFAKPVVEPTADAALLDSFYADDAPEAATPDRLGGSWMYLLGAAGLGLLFVARKKVLGKVAEVTQGKKELVVVARQGLGQQGGLVLIEASTGDGGTRRLLVGVAPGTTPALVADLGGDFAGFIEEDIPAAPAMAAPIAAPNAAPIPARMPAPTRALRPEPTPAPVIDDAPALDGSPRPKRALVGRFTDADLAPLPDDPWNQASGLDDHLSLVDQVLTGRLH